METGILILVIILTLPSLLPAHNILTSIITLFVPLLRSIRRGERPKDGKERGIITYDVHHGWSSTLTVGIYFYQLEVEFFTDTKRMVIIK